MEKTVNLQVTVVIIITNTLTKTKSSQNELVKKSADLYDFYAKNHLIKEFTREKNESVRVAINRSFEKNKFLKVCKN